MMKQAQSGFEGLGKTGVDAAMKAADAVTRGFQALAAETAEYSQRTIDMNTSAFGKLSGVRSLDAAMAVQSDYAKAFYEGYVGQLTKVGEIVGQMATEAAGPYGGYFGKNGK